MQLSLLVPPAVEPVTLAQAKSQLGFGPGEDLDEVRSRQLSDQLRPYISAARQVCENYTRRSFITQTWRLKLDSFPSAHTGGNLWANCAGDYSRSTRLELPRFPVQSIAAFTYRDGSGVTQTAAYSGAAGGFDPLVLSPAWGAAWPYGQPIIDFVAGYGNTPDTVPQAIRTAILFLVQAYYDKGLDAEMPSVVKLLLDPFVEVTV